MLATISDPQIIATANRPQANFLSLPQRFRGFVGGYGSGKTYVGSMAICLHAWKFPRFNMGYFAPTYPQIRDIFYPTIENVAFNLGLDIDVKEANKEVHIFSGGKYRSTVICRSMERPQTIIGFKIAHALVDEIDTMPVDKATQAWRKIIARMRYEGAHNSIDLTTTPEGFKFTYQLFVKALQEDPAKAGRYGLIQASTYDNEANLPEDYIPGLLEAYPAELIQAYLNGQFVNLTSGVVYRQYNRKKHDSKETIQEKEPLFIGMDFNVLKMAACVFVKRKNGWHCVAELKNILDTREMSRVIRERWQDAGHKIIVYPDASGASRKSLDANKSDIAELQQAGFEVRYHAANPSVRDRVNAVNKRLEIQMLWVNASACPTVADCLEQQIYDDNGEPDKSSGHDHQNDAFGYPIAFEFPVRKPVHKFNINFVN